MKKLHKILNEITELITNIETNYPELYRSLDENPMTLPVSQNPQMGKVVMQEYLDSLKELLESYVDEEKIKNSL
ncbi:hypothetical protein ADIWIN_2501 [Winogradskyella psychrotolerans RS-3]|uniref:Uncharacterized protein n=1 Tax=Winogradskyella psychrotolerans RS-3 TaxID=641526 RepID=S7VQR6_9FLAO|nr:hypothetical protein [Winogradskyella psychrotolerans]EPR72331.1 hypothetical protein ADIWIN_2501 [Winogradskyella psychrotolerans RS-3]